MKSLPITFWCLVVVASLLISLADAVEKPRGGGNTASNASGRDSLVRLIEKERQETQEWLKSSPLSYLAAIRRVDFDDRTTLTVGRSPENDVSVDDSAFCDRHLQVVVRGDSFLVRSLSAAAFFTVDGKRVSEAVLPPSSIGVGRYSIRLSHQRFPALIICDPSSPRFKEYKSIKYFPVDLNYRYLIPLKPQEKKDTVIILSSRGNRRKALRVGCFEFRVKGKLCRLGVTRLLEPGVGENSYSIFFRDQTCGKQSYPMGRYVEAEERSDGLFVVDFNRAYNPACAYSPYYNCPVPPAENDLPVRIPAGERDSHYAVH
jgi:uncharacterized protein